MSDAVTIKGLKETQREMERIVRELRGGRLLEAMRKATLIVQADAKRKAPVDTGRLRASITPEIRATPGSGIRGVVGSVVVYAPYQEFGTKRMAAHPYLYPAFDENKDRIAKIISDAVAEIVK